MPRSAPKREAVIRAARSDTKRPASEIAKELGVSENYARQVCLQAGIPLKGGRAEYSPAYYLPDRHKEWLAKEAERIGVTSTFLLMKIIEDAMGAAE